jgi:hypothetical protein
MEGHYFGWAPTATNNTSRGGEANEAAGYHYR